VTLPLEVDEAERLRALGETGLLDTPPEEDFDNLVRLASVICDTPIALITLLDSQRQWFKANVGATMTQTDRDVAFCAHTILQPDHLIVNDAWKDERFSRNPLVTGDPGIRFYAGLPLETEDGYRLGSLCVIDTTPRHLTERQMEALQLLCLQAKKHINLRRQQHKMLLAAEQSSLIERELRASQDLFHAFMDNAPFLAFMRDAQGTMIYYNQAYANRFHVDREEWVGKSNEDLWPADVVANLRANDAAVMREWKTTVVEEQLDPAHGPPGHWRSYKFPFRDSTGCEFVAGFSVDATADKEADLRIVRYQRALEEANEKLQELAVTDGLTQLLNRRAFDIALEREFAGSHRNGHPLSLIILDIDDFKSFNDCFGHEVGDRVLQAVAGAIAGCFRISDTVARYGGEEFAILLPDTTRSAAAESAERLRLSVRDLIVEGRRVTISIGASTKSQDSPDTKGDLLRRADEALYRAKRDGKDRIRVG
jgi:diguanylate cyclase (GGDEF)-like protein